MNLVAGLRSALLLSVFVVSSTSHADNAFYIKGGLTKLMDNSQTLDSTPRTLDDAGAGTYGFLFEHRLRRNIALGVEYFSYNMDFLPPDTTGHGVATTRTVQFIAKKYFGERMFRPYFGVGIGIAHTSVDYGSGSWEDDDIGVAGQVALGFELRFEELGLQVEAKRQFSDMGTSNSGYDPSAAGVFVGIGFNW